MINVDLSISANIMVKNEEHTIVRCVESLFDFVDEIIIVDTGSTDKTLELINEMIAKYFFRKIHLLFHEWNDDFALVRNYMKQSSNGDTIFQIDADEFLKQSQDFKLVKKSIVNILNHKDNVVISPTIVDINGSIYKPIPRIFKNNANLLYVGNVHEELRCVNGSSLNSEHIDLVMYHDGYTMDKILSKSKLERNIHLLNKMIEKEPNNPRWSYFFIREMYYYGADRQLIIKKAESFINSEKDCSNFMLVYVILGLCYGETNNYEKSNKIAIYLKENNNIIDALFLQLTRVHSLIKAQSSELNIIIKQLCNIENFNSLINSNGDHVKVQLFKLLFSLSRYDEAFSILEEINYYTSKELIIPQLIFIKQYIDQSLNQQDNRVSDIS